MRFLEGKVRDFQSSLQCHHILTKCVCTTLTCLLFLWFHHKLHSPGQTRGTHWWPWTQKLFNHSRRHWPVLSVHISLSAYIKKLIVDFSFDGITLQSDSYSIRGVPWMLEIRKIPLESWEMLKPRRWDVVRRH